MANKVNGKNSNNNAGTKRPELDDIAKSLRAVITSRKQPCTLRDLLHDYRDLEDEQLNFRKFGCQSLEELLKKCGEFSITNVGNQTYVSANYSDKSAHIAELVSRQRPSRKSRGDIRKLRYPRRTENNYPKSTHSILPPRLQEQSHRPILQQATQNNKMQQQKSVKNNHNNNDQQIDLRERLNANKRQQQQQQQQQPAPIQQIQQQSTIQASKPRAILGQKKTTEKVVKEENNINGITSQLPSKYAKPMNSSSKIQQRLKQPTPKPTPTPTPITIPIPIIPATVNIPNLMELTITKPIVEPKQDKSQKNQESSKILPLQVFQFNKQLDPITSLEQYCLVRGYDKPKYTSLYSKFNKSYQSRVELNSVIYSTYPNEYPTEHIAKMNSAERAIEMIQQQEKRPPLPLCTDSDEELVNKLYKQIVKHKHGLFVKNIPECFEEEYNKALPDHWWTLVQTSNKFITEPTAGDKIIILANENVTQVSVNSPVLQSPTDAYGNGMLPIKMEEIVLPLNFRYWNVYITYCKSTIHICGRLIGREYSELYDAVCNAIANEEKIIAEKIYAQGVYLVQVADNWHRVLVKELDKPKNMALCHFVDFGDKEWLDMSTLYICDAKYLSLPAQAVSFSLFGLEDFAENPYTHSVLEAQLLHKSFVADVLTKELEYYENKTKDDEEDIAGGIGNTVQTVLFDTSSDADINENSLLLQLICDNTPQPAFKNTGVTKVYVTNICDDGTLYMQIIDKNLNYVEKLIGKLVESKFKRDQHMITKDDLERAELFLICDEDANTKQTLWYRGKLTHKPTSYTDQTYEIFFVDYGIIKRINIAHMFRLESLSTALSKFPAQAIKVQLHNIPPITPNIVGRIRGLLPKNCEALVKLVVNSEVPWVIVYKRIEGADTLCTVNDVIRIEHDLEDLDDNSDFTGVAEVSNNTINKQRSSSPKIINNNKSVELKKLTSFNNLPQVGEYFNVYVTISANPNNFMVIPYKLLKEFRDLMKDMQVYYKDEKSVLPTNKIEIGQAYAAKNADGHYTRVEVVKKIDTDMFNVKYCDFGDFTVLRNTDLKMLPNQFRQLPKISIAAKLCDAVPIENDWTVENCARFRQLTVGKNLVSVIQSIEKDEQTNEMILEMQLINVETDEDIYIKNVLRTEGHIK